MCGKPVKERRRSGSSASSLSPWQSTSIKASREGKARFPKCFSRRSSASMFHGIDLGTVGRLLDQANIGGDHQLVRVMPACPIDLHDNEVLRESLAHLLQEESHHGGIGRRPDQRGHLSQSRSHSRVDIDVLSHQLAGDVWPDAWRSPTPCGAADAAKAAFILDHDQHRALIFGWPRCDCRLNLRCKVFLNCS